MDVQVGDMRVREMIFEQDMEIARLRRVIAMLAPAHAYASAQALRRRDKHADKLAEWRRAKHELEAERDAERTAGARKLAEVEARYTAEIDVLLRQLQRMQGDLDTQHRVVRDLYATEEMLESERTVLLVQVQELEGRVAELQDREAVVQAKAHEYVLTYQRQYLQVNGEVQRLRDELVACQHQVAPLQYQNGSLVRNVEKLKAAIQRSSRIRPAVVPDDLE